MAKEFKFYAIQDCPETEPISIERQLSSLLLKVFEKNLPKITAHKYSVPLSCQFTWVVFNNGLAVATSKLPSDG